MWTLRATWCPGWRHVGDPLLDGLPFQRRSLKWVWSSCARCNSVASECERVRNQTAERQEWHMLQRQLFSLAGSQTGTPSAASLYCPLAGGASATLCPPVRPLLCLVALPSLSLSLSLVAIAHQTFQAFTTFFLLFFGFFRAYKKKKFPDSAPPLSPPRTTSLSLIGSPVTCECGTVVPMPSLFCRSVRWKAPAPPPRSGARAGVSVQGRGREGGKEGGGWSSNTGWIFVGISAVTWETENKTGTKGTAENLQNCSSKLLWSLRIHKRQLRL